MALQACDKANIDKSEVIKAQKEAIKQCHDRVAELESNESATINNKGFFFILGAVFTVLIKLVIP